MTTVFEQVKAVLPARRVLENYLGPSRGAWRCPFHEDRTPSLSAYGNAIRCFGCGWRGDLFRFIEDFEGVSRCEALHIAADLAGVILPKKRPKRKKHVSLDVTLREIQCETVRIEREIFKLAESSAADAWRRAWSLRHDHKALWDAVAVAVGLDREVDMLRGEVECQI